ncbi:MAG: hypothetical protein R2681_16770 [Pyrinomonadaceae bacterium]
MTKFTSPLDGIKVASPCSANWDEMYGDNRQRHCGECKMNVYNLSEMTKQEAESLIMNAEGRLCARFYRRADGTILTKDCPVGWKAVKKQMSKFWTAAASIVLTALSGIGITAYMNKQSANDHPDIMGAIAVETPQNTDPEPTVGEIPLKKTNEPEMIMGDVALPAEKENEIMGRIATDRDR